VAIYNIIIGAVLFLINRISAKKWWVFAIQLMFLEKILTMPRDASLAWLTNGINISNVLTLLLIYALSSQLYSRRKMLNKVSGDLL
jgi:hypothetical protein